MNKNKINHYSIGTLCALCICNIFLRWIKISGLLYEIGILLFLIANAIILVKYRHEIKYKDILFIQYFFITPFSKNTILLYFALFSSGLFLFLSFKESILTKIMTIILSIASVFLLPLFLLFLILFESNNIYEDTHYYCEKHTELYAYSAGAMDSFHYRMGKYYEIIKINDILSITIQTSHEKQKEDYEDYLDTHDCIWAGDQIGLK